MALSAQTGPAFLFGVPDEAVLRGVAASASELVMHCGQSRLREIRSGLRDTFAVALHGCTKDGEGLPVYDQPCATCVISELPQRGAEDALERALSMLADGGDVWLFVPRRTSGAEARLRRFMDAACGGNVNIVAGAPADMLALHGVRSCAVICENAEEQPPALPVSAIVLTHGAEVGLEETLVDLVLRQHFPPLEVFVLDLGRGPALDADLFGLAQRSSVPLAVFPKHDVAVADALHDALGGVRGRFVHWCRAGSRLAPHLLTTLGLAMERSDKCAVVFGRSAAHVDGQWNLVHEAAEHGPTHLLSSTRFAAEATLWKKTALRACAAPNPAFGIYCERELAWRLLQRHAHASVGVVVAGHNTAPSSHHGHELWQSFLRATLPDLLAESTELQALAHLKCHDAPWVLEHVSEDSSAQRLLRAQALLQSGNAAAAQAALEATELQGHPAACALRVALACSAAGATAFSALVAAMQIAGVEDALWLLDGAPPPTA